MDDSLEGLQGQCVWSLPYILLRGAVLCPRQFSAVCHATEKQAGATVSEGENPIKGLNVAFASSQARAAFIQLTNQLQGFATLTGSHSGR